MRLIMFVLALLLSIGANAQQTLFRQSTPLIPVLPENGGFFDASKPGNGLMLEVADDGFLFGAFFYYDQIGVAKWATISGFCVPTTETERMTTGVICRLTQPTAAEARDGQCWGCPWRQNITFGSTDINNSVEVVFFGPNRGEFRAAGAVLPLARLSEIYPGQTVRDRLLGKWSRVRYRLARNCGTCAEYAVAQAIGVVEVRPITTRINFWDVPNPGGSPNPKVDALPAFPAATVTQYDVVCIDTAGAGSSCIGFSNQVEQPSPDQLMYEEQGTGLVRLARVCINQGLPDCVKFEGPIGALVKSNSYRDRGDVYVGKDVLHVRRTTNEFVIAEEEVWTRVPSEPFVSISTVWP